MPVTTSNVNVLNTLTEIQRLEEYIKITYCGTMNTGCHTQLISY